MVNSSTAFTERSENDAGVTLVELRVYMVLFALVVTMIASTFISGRRVEKDVSSMTRASNETQLFLAPLEWSVRNSTTLQVAETDFDSDLLVVKTRVDGGPENDDPGSWECIAWFYDEPTQTIYQRSGPATGTPVTAGLPSGFSLSSWRPVLQRVERTVDAGNPVPIFTTTGVGGGTLINFDTATSREKTPVAIDTVVIPRVQALARRQ